jgi:L-2-hydroxyglutarate oxidase LhgO
MSDVSVTVVGAGVVGLAVAARLAPEYPDLVILERNERHGSETSSRNSEVIHAGMYYTPGSLKARLCVEGNRGLYAFCARHDVPHRRTGKLITAASEDEVPRLEALQRRGQANGVELRLLSAREVRALEPHVASVAALESPSTGIVSAHVLMDALLHQARAGGALLHSHARLLSLEHRGADYLLTIDRGDERESFSSELVVNAAGLESDTVAALAGIDVEAAGYRLHYCKGSYFSVPGSKSSLVSRLVYPVPGRVSLGVHAVIGLEGRLRFGPDAEYLPDRRLDYSVDEDKRAAFGVAARHLLPDIADEDLSPDISGIRAKLQGPGEDFRDFVVSEESAGGLPGLVNLVGMDSPGLTSALAIAEEVARLLAG